MIGDFVSVVCPLIAVGGWYFVYRNSNRIATRSEAYALVAKAVDKVLEIDKRCADYWAVDESKRDRPDAWVAGTQAQLYAVRTLLEILEKHHAFTDKDMTLMKLRMAATLNAESIERMGQEELLKKRRTQAEAQNYALHVLYGYYRTSFN
jgi:hypothetical protein